MRNKYSGVQHSTSLQRVSAVWERLLKIQQFLFKLNSLGYTYYKK